MEENNNQFKSIMQYIRPNRKFFEKQVPEEDEEISLTEEIHHKHEKIDKIFESFFDYESISYAKVYYIIILFI